MIYALYIFTRGGECVYVRKWNKDRQRRHRQLDHEKKNLFGLLFSLKQFANALTPAALGETENETFHSFQTDEYKLHYLETLSGLRFVMLTDRAVGRATDALRAVYRLYADTWARSPLFEPGKEVSSAAFASGTDAVVRQLHYFASESL